jgi:hypothetical protein
MDDLLPQAFAVDGEYDPTSGPPTNGIEYLRHVRWEASRLPNVNVAQVCCFIMHLIFFFDEYKQLFLFRSIHDNSTKNRHFLYQQRNRIPQRCLNFFLLQNGKSNSWKTFCS